MGYVAKKRKTMAGTSHLELPLYCGGGIAGTQPIIHGG